MSAITLTDSAAAHIKTLLADAPAGTKGLRLGVKPTGCSGNSYDMSFIAGDDTAIGNDDVFTHESGAALYIPRTQSWMLFGLTVDYVADALGNSKFAFTNPNETSRCGCGESFHVDVKDMKIEQATT